MMKLRGGNEPRGGRRDGRLTAEAQRAQRQKISRGGAEVQRIRRVIGKEFGRRLCMAQTTPKFFPVRVNPAASASPWLISRLCGLRVSAVNLLSPLPHLPR